MNYFMGIDIGSQSSKGVIVDENSNVVAKHSISHIMENLKPGFFEQDAEKIWWNEFCSISKNLIEKSRLDKEDIKAIGHSATSPCLTFLDKDNNLLRNAILYGIDTRAHKEIAYLNESIGEEALINTGGCILSSQSVIPKVLWVKNNEPDVFNNTRKILSAMGYITYKLTGKYTQNSYDAVGYTGAFDIFRKVWIDTYIKNIVPTEYFGELVSPSKFVGSLTKEAALQTGLSEDTLVLPGIADAAAESLSCGVFNKGEMMLMLGTSSFFILLTDKLHKTNKFWPSNFLFEDEYVLTGGASNCGSAIIWFLNTFMDSNTNEDVYTKLLEEANQNNISDRSPLCIPYFAGERTPIHDPNAKAIFFGLDFMHSRATLYKSLLEGIAYSIKNNIEEIKKLTNINKIHIIGGGIKNPLFIKLIVDICQVSVSIPSIDIGACFGDAILAIKAYNPKVSMKDFVSIEEEISFSADNVELYQNRYNKFQELYKITRGLL